MDVAGDKGKPLRGKGAAHANELMEMLKEAKTPAQRRILAQELAATRAGAADKRARALSKVRVVGTTTASCGNAALEGMNFDVVVLDECSQMTEPSSMLAMSRFGCRALVAVGDPKQLPPVLDSKDLVLPADSKDSNNSHNPLAKGIFVRLREAGHPATLLRTQYRLHPKLSETPNRCYYDGELVDGCDAAERGARVAVNGAPLNPLTWIDSGSRDVTQDGGSKYSPSEARFAALIAARVVEVGVSAGEVGVITLYKAQERAIVNNLAGILSREGVKDVCEEDDVGGEDDGAVKVSTVDAFQGQEKDVIILSLCGAHGGSGFVTPERINVALTRARRHLIVLGDSRAPGMNKHPAWGSCLKISRTSPNGYKPSFTVDGELRDWLDGWSGADLTMRQSPGPTSQSPDPHGSPVDEHERIVLDESIEDLSTPPSRKAEREDAVELDDDVVELDEAPVVELDAALPVDLDACPSRGAGRAFPSRGAGRAFPSRVPSRNGIPRRGRLDEGPDARAPEPRPRRRHLTGGAIGDPRRARQGWVHPGRLLARVQGHPQGCAVPRRGLAAKGGDEQAGARRRPVFRYIHGHRGSVRMAKDVVSARADP